MLKFGSLELANVSFSGCYIRVILSKDPRNKDRKKSSETKTRDEKIRDVLIHKDRFASDCFMLASLGSIPASVGTVESDGRQMKQC